MQINLKKNLILIIILILLIIINVKIYSEINMAPQSTPENSNARKFMWSENRQLTTTETSGNYSVALNKDKDIFLIYSDRKSTDKHASIYFEKFSRYGEPELGPINVGPPELAATGNPFLHFLTENSGIMGYRVTDKSVDDILYQFQTDNNKFNYRKLKLKEPDSKTNLKIFAAHHSENNKKSYLVLGSYLNNKLEKIKIISFSAPSDYNTTEINTDQKISANTEHLLIQPDDNKFHLFCLEPDMDLFNLKKISLTADGQIISNANIDKIGVELSRPHYIQVRKVGNNFHLAWIEKLSGMKTTHNFNYLIIDENGDVLHSEKQFLPTGGFSPGFHLINNSGNIEVYLARSSGSTTEYSNTGTDIYHSIHNPDLKMIESPQPIITNKTYEKYPYLLQQNNDKYLFWFVDKDRGGEIHFAGNSEEMIEYMKNNRSLKQKFTNLLAGITDVIIKVVMALIFTVVCSLLVIIAFIIYSFLGRYLKNNILYWLTSILLLFTIKLYNETILTSWQHPQYSTIYFTHLIFMILIMVFIGGYWWWSNPQDRPYQHEILNKIILGWVFVEGFVTYFNNISTFYGFF